MIQRRRNLYTFQAARPNKTRVVERVGSAEKKINTKTTREKMKTTVETAVETAVGVGSVQSQTTKGAFLNGDHEKSFNLT